MTTLKAALQEACFMELEDIPSEVELSTNETLIFSSAFEKKMKKLIRRADHPIRYRIIRAAACVLLAAVLSGCTVLAFVPEARASFSRWVKEVYETHIVYRYAGEGNYTGSTVSEEYRPTWIPNGYEEYYASNSENDFTVLYANDIGQNLTFSYSTDMTGSAWYIENSITSTKQVYVNEMPADILIADNIETGSAIVWVDSQNTAFYISAFLDEVDLIRMAESVQKHNLPQYKITEPPEGFVETSRVQVDTIILCTYTGSDGSIFFRYVPMSDGIIEAVTTNGIEPEAVVINGMTGDFYLSNDASKTNELIWFDQNAKIAFSLSSYFDKAVMIRMAESVSLV